MYPGTWARATPDQQTLVMAGKADPAVAVAELTAYARERVGHFKVPRDFVATDDLPRTPTGKLVKGDLRDRYATEAQR